MFGPSAIHRQHFQKVTLICLFSLLSVALIIAWNTPATGYESSIYRSTPLILWVSLIASMIVGISLVVVPIAKKEVEQNFLCKIGFLLVFLCYTICLALFIIRGYYMWCMTGDPASHIGLIKETLNAGQAPVTLIYPITHIYLTEIISLTNLDLVFLHKVVPLIFGLLCVLFMYVLAKTIFVKNSIYLLVGILSCCLAYSWYLRLTPNILANFFLPFVIFLVYKNVQKRTWAWVVPLVITLVLVPIFHVVPTMILTLVFMSICIFAALSCIGNRWKIRKLNDSVGETHRRIIILFSIMVIWWIFWVSLFSIFYHQILSLYDAIAFGTDDAWMNSLGDTASTATAYGYNVIEQIVRNLWGQLILCALSALSLPLVIKGYLESRDDTRILSLLLVFVIVLPLSATFYLFDLAFTPQRLLYAISMFGTFFAAYFLSFFLTSNAKCHLLPFNARAKSAIVIVIVLGLFMGGLLALYPSPYILSASWQNTHSEIEGLLFTYDHRDVTVPLTGILTAPGRSSHALLAPEKRATQGLPLYPEDQPIPYRFGYDVNFSISSVCTREIDIIITQKDKIQYVEALPELAELRYTRHDFDRLRIDPALHFLYSNGEFDYYKVSVQASVPNI
jgi:hypothetical protein